MTILLVDDDPDIMEGIADGVDFEAIGIDKVLMAAGAPAARRLMQSHPVDILLTDIEMPGESGLDLLAWCLANDTHIVALFYTSYADFDYAKKALEMHSFDYLLKPVAYTELQAKLEKAVRHAAKQRQAQTLEQSRKDMLPSLKREFWRRCLLDDSIAPVDFAALAAANHVEYTREQAFLLCLVKLTDKKAVPAAWKKYALLNIVDDLLADEKLAAEAVLQAGQGVWCLVLPGEEGKVQAFCSSLIGKAPQPLAAAVTCYAGDVQPAAGLPGAFAALADACRDDVAALTAVVRPGAAGRPIPVYSPPPVQAWAALLAAHKKQELAHAAGQYLDELVAQGQMSSAVLKAFELDITQAVYGQLSQHGIDAAEFARAAGLEALRDGAVASVPAAKQYVGRLADAAVQYLQSRAESQSITGRIKEYILAHMAEELSRVGIAQAFYLNADYLGRLFKKETGQSLGSFIQAARMERAKTLLSQTDAPVNRVAAEVGYDSISYFSQVFREHTGLRPVEYRRQSRL